MIHGLDEMLQAEENAATTIADGPVSSASAWIDGVRHKVIDVDTGETGGTCGWTVSDEPVFRIDSTGRPVTTETVYYDGVTITKILGRHPLNRPRKPKSINIRQAPRYPRRCRPRPRETPGVNPLQKLINGKANHE